MNGVGTQVPDHPLNLTTMGGRHLLRGQQVLGGWGCGLWGRVGGTRGEGTHNARKMN